MSSALSLRRNLSWALVGNAGYAACQWGMLVALARLGSPELVGRYALAQAITAPVVMFANLQLRQMQVADASGAIPFGRFLRLRLATLVIAVGTIVTIVLARADSIGVAAVILLVGGAKVVESVSDLYYGCQQRNERMDRIAASLLARGALALAALSLGLALAGSLIWGAAGVVACWAVVLVMYDARSCRYASTAHALDRTVLTAHELRATWRLAQQAAPLGVVMLLISVNANLPRYFVEAGIGERELGIFAALSSPFAVGALLVSALGQSASPRLARQASSGDLPAFIRLLRRLVLSGAALCVTGVVASLAVGKPALHWVFGGEYVYYADVFVWLSLAAGIGYMASILGYAMTALQRFRSQVPLFAAVCAATVVTAWILVPRLGLAGAALATVGAGLVQLFGSGAVVYAGLAQAMRAPDRIDETQARAA